MCLSIYVKDTEIILAGTSINSMSVKEREKNGEYKKFADKYDIHFIFDDNIPICYIDKNRTCYLIADNGKDFLKNVQN
jgi:hypothetical protein